MSRDSLLGLYIYMPWNGLISSIDFAKRGLNMTIKYLITAIAFGCVGACHHAGQLDEGADTTVTVGAVERPTLSDPSTFNEADQTACTDFGGTYTRAGLLGYYNCFVDYTDGGSVCSDTSDCEGRCMASSIQDTSAQQTGTCQLTSNPFGCNAEVINGVVQPGLCVD